MVVFLNYLHGDILLSSFAAKKAHRCGGQKVNLEPLGVWLYWRALRARFPANTKKQTVSKHKCGYQRKSAHQQLCLPLSKACSYQIPGQSIHYPCGGGTHGYTQKCYQQQNSPPPFCGLKDKELQVVNDLMSNIIT